MSVDFPQEIITAAIHTGDVFLQNFEGIYHPKFFIVTGITRNRLTVCSIFINSRIHPSLYNKPILLNAQVPLKKSDNAFLAHDSFANCSHTLIMEMSAIASGIANGTCKVIGRLNENDLATVRRTIVDTGLLSGEEESLFFWDIVR